MRTDGLRVEKVADVRPEWVEDPYGPEGSGYWDDDEPDNHPITRYFYDGQMSVEDDYAEITTGNDPDYWVTRNGIEITGKACRGYSFGG